MKSRKFFKNNGITLVSLVVTIIVLIILAGTSINLLLGKNGIITIAKQAKENTELAKIEEETALNELYKEIEAEGGTSGGISYDAIAKLMEFKEKIAQAITTAGIQTSKEDSIETMASNIEQLPNSNESVYYVTLSDGYKLPVPRNFYYVGGNLDNGIIISDDSDDRYGYNPETKQNDTTLDKTTYEYTTSLKGNQFVWIPCSTSEYHKTNIWNGEEQQPGTLTNAYWDTTTPKSELTQIEKYGGFYVARYEAGLASTITEFLDDQVHTGSNQKYNLDGVPKSKAGVVPWMFIDCTHSKINAESMYNNDYVSSGLITGTQWDVILNKMVLKKVITASDLTDSSSWGNYRNTILSYNGRLAVTDYNKTNLSKWTLKPFGKATSGTTSNYTTANTYGDLLTTGASSTTERYHIFDFAGNLSEWTEEDSRYRNTSLDQTAQDETQYRVLRGGSCAYASDTHPVCYRIGGGTISYTSLDLGFRVVLYIK